MSEMALTADHLIVIGKGRLIAAASVAELIKGSSGRSVLVRTPDGGALLARMTGAGARVDPQDDGSLLVSGLEASAIGEMAASLGAVLHELSPKEASLEEAFMELTEDSAEFRSASGVAVGK